MLHRYHLGGLDQDPAAEDLDDGPVPGDTEGGDEPADGDPDGRRIPVDAPYLRASR